MICSLIEHGMTCILILKLHRTIRMSRHTVLYQRTKHAQLCFNCLMNDCLSLVGLVTSPSSIVPCDPDQSVLDFLQEPNVLGSYKAKKLSCFYSKHCQDYVPHYYGLQLFSLSATVCFATYVSTRHFMFLREITFLLISSK